MNIEDNAFLFVQNGFLVFFNTWEIYLMSSHEESIKKNNRLLKLNILQSTTRKKVKFLYSPFLL